MLSGFAGSHLKVQSFIYPYYDVRQHAMDNPRSSQKEEEEQALEWY